MGIVYYANYFVWMEIARTEWFNSVCGRSYEEIEKAGLFLPVLEARCQYKSPVKYPEEVKITLTARIISKIYIEFYYDISVEGKARAIGFTKHIFMNKSGRVCKIPKDIYYSIDAETMPKQ